MAESFLLGAASNAVGTLVADVVKKPLEHYLPHLFGKKVSSSDPNPDLEFSPKKDLAPSKSYTNAFNKIMDALKDDKVSTIGVWGMGGVGKTTLVSDVGRTAKALLSHKVIMVVVSQTADIGKIQGRIADSLNFKFGNDTQQGKAEELWVRLEKEERLLIVLDDVWKMVNLREIGIPLDGNRKGCKIILTTRRKQVCESMASQATVRLGVLEEDEAWALFKKKADLNEGKDNAETIEVAREVAKKCKGLPVAIVTLASAVKGAKTVMEWEVALKKLQSCRLMEIGNIEEEVEQNAYMCLKTSYEYLKKDSTKKCFLLCGLYPEDHSIDAEDLVRFAWGLKLYPNADSIKEVRVEVMNAIDHLIDSCLLLEDDEEDDGERYIKLHDVVRDVAEWIATDEDNGLVIKLGSKQKLEILLHHTYDCNTPMNNFEEMRELKVLKLKASNCHRYDDSVFSLNALKSLTNLRALQLEGFYQIKDISALANLTKLEILHLHRSEFPESIDKVGELKNLKVFDMRDCPLLSGFPCNLIRRLVEVEELYLYDNRINLRKGTKNIDAAILLELKFLPRLAALSLELPSLQFPQDFLFPRLQRYQIVINSVFWEDISISSRSLGCKGELPLNVVSELLRNVEFLQVNDMMEKEIKYLTVTTPGDVPVATILQNLRNLDISGCENLQVIFQVKKAENVTLLLSKLKRCSLLLSKLKHFTLRELPNLEYIWKVPTQHISLASLEVVMLIKCRKLKSVFSFSLAQSLVCLEELNIEDCDELQQIMEEMEGNHEHEISLATNLEKPLCLSKLSTLEIIHCRSLECIFPKYMAPQLTDLKLEDCPKLTDVTVHSESACLKGIQLSKLEGSFVSTKYLVIEDMKDDHNLIPEVDREGLNELIDLELRNYRSVEYLVDTTKEENVPDTAFTKLVDLEIFQMGVLKRLCNGKFPKRFLQNLEKLKVEDCDELEEVFQIDENLLKGSPPYFSLRSLKVVEIVYCRKLKSLFSSSLIQSLQLLEELDISFCDELRTLFTELENDDGEAEPSSHPLCLPRLISLRISYCARVEYVLPISYYAKLKQVFGVLKQQDGEKHHIELPCLTDLTLEDLPNLSNFGPENYIVNSPALKNLSVSACPQLMKCTNQEEVNNHSIHSELKNITQEVEGLTSLKLRDCMDLECLADTTKDCKIRDCRSVTDTAFTNLVELSLHGMDGLKRLCNGKFPKRFLQNLKELEVIFCDELEEVFPIDENLLKGSPPYFSLQSLKVVEIVYCRKLKSLFSSSLIQSLQLLERLSILSCGELKNLFTELENDGGETVSSSHPLCLPKLKELIIKRCDGLEYVLPITLAQEGLPQLEKLEIESCYKLKQVFGVVKQHDGGKHRIELENDGGETESSSHPLSLPRLITLRTYDCKRLEYVLPITLAQGLPKLGKLEIERCGELKQVFGVVKQLDGVKHRIELPCLTDLKLDDLPKFSSFGPKNYIVNSPALRKLINQAEVKNDRLRFELLKAFRQYDDDDDNYVDVDDYEDDDEPISQLPTNVEEADEISTMK